MRNVNDFHLELSASKSQLYHFAKCLCFTGESHVHMYVGVGVYVCASACE